MDFWGNGLIWFFTDVRFFGLVVGEAMAFFLALGLVFSSIYLIWRHYRKYHVNLIEAIRQRSAYISNLTGGPNANIQDARDAFSRHWIEIDECMEAQAQELEQPLHRVWQEYRETIIDPREKIIRNSVRPHEFFFQISEGHKYLLWLANISIAIGLLITFLGIIAALSTIDFSAGGNQQLQNGIEGLLQVVGAKFWASVGGIAASILLRIADYKFTEHTDREILLLCDLIERGTCYQPPQKIAADQLEQLIKQTPALETFGEQIAVVLEEALNKQFTPMVASLGSIKEGIDSISGGGIQGIKEGFVEGAGAQMQGLAEAIGNMTQSLAVMTEKVGDQTGKADEQIQAAVERLSGASEEISKAFRQLNDDFTQAAKKIGEENESVNRQAKEAMNALEKRLSDTVDAMGKSMSGASKGFEDTADTLNKNLSDLVAQFEKNNSDLNSKSHEQLANIITDMQSAVDGMKKKIREGAEGFADATSDAAKKAAAEGMEALNQAFSTFVMRFEETGTPLVKSMGTAAQSIEGAAYAIDHTGQAFGGLSQSIERMVDAANGAAREIGVAGERFREAAEPITRSTTEIRTAVTALNQNLGQFVEKNDYMLEQIGVLADRIIETSDAAAGAWNDYRERFDDVDESLGKALATLSDAIQDNAQKVNERVQQIDTALGKGVSGLAAALQPLENLSDIVEEIAVLLSKNSENTE